jgi:hypothetical protein
MNIYFKKYLKYKNKYLLLLKGGTSSEITFLSSLTGEVLLTLRLDLDDVQDYSSFCNLVSQKIPNERKKIIEYRFNTEIINPSNYKRIISNCNIIYITYVDLPELYTNKGNLVFHGFVVIYKGNVIMKRLDSLKISDENNKKLINIMKINSTIKECVCIDHDNCAKTLGVPFFGDETETETKTKTKEFYSLLENEKIEQFYSTYFAFAGLTNTRTVITWGNSINGGDSSKVKDKLIKIKTIYSTNFAFAALSEEGTVITWGCPHRGGNSSGVTEKLRGIIKIYSTSSAFAAINEEGTVITWGDHDEGGDSSNVKKRLINIKNIYSSSSVFAAINNENEVIIWGSPDNGGPWRLFDENILKCWRSSKLKSSWGSDMELLDRNNFELSNIKEIYSTQFGFTALTIDGKVITLGSYNIFVTIDILGNVIDINYEDLISKLNEGNILKVYSAHFAFVAVTFDGSMIIWTKDIHDRMPTI